ncbi:hypothetical protein scyTo_0011915, partial [Scyliorhinus torazame]|nr:hypothetical protein [Scyliorhinus torazame]
MGVVVALLLYAPLLHTPLLYAPLLHAPLLYAPLLYALLLHAPLLYAPLLYAPLLHAPLLHAPLLHALLLYAPLLHAPLLYAPLLYAPLLHAPLLNAPLLHALLLYAPLLYAPLLYAPLLHAPLLHAPLLHALLLYAPLLYAPLLHAPLLHALLLHAPLLYAPLLHAPLLYAPLLSSGSVQCLKEAEAEPGERDSVCELPTEFVETVRPRPQGSSPVYDYSLIEEYKGKKVPEEIPHEVFDDITDLKKDLEIMSKKQLSSNMSREVEEKEEDVVEVLVNTEAEVGATGFSVKSGEKEGIFIRHVLKESPAAKRLSMREGDQLISATIYFDNIKYEDALKILQYSEPYKMKYCLKRTIPSPIRSEAIEVKGRKLIAGVEEDLFAKLYGKKTKIARDASEDMNTQTERQMQEMTQKGKTKVAEVPDVTFSCPKFPAFKKTRTYKLDRSHSLSETEEHDQQDIPATSTDIESHLKTAEPPQKVKKRRRKIKLPHIGARGTKMGKTEASEEEKEAPSLKYDTLQANAESAAQNANGAAITTIKQPDPKLENQIESDNVNIESKLKMPKLKIAKFVLSEPSLPTIEMETKLPEENMHLQTSDTCMECPKIEIGYSERNTDTRSPILIAASEIQLKTGGERPKVKSQMAGELGEISDQPTQQNASQKELGTTDGKSDASSPLHEGREARIGVQIAGIQIPKSETRTKKPKTDKQEKTKKPKKKDASAKTLGTQPKSSTLAIDVSLMKVDATVSSTDTDLKEPAGKVMPGKMKGDLMSGMAELEDFSSSMGISMKKKHNIPGTKYQTDGRDQEWETFAPELEGAEEVPSMHVNEGGNGEKYKIKGPQFGFSTPEVKAPKMNLEVKHPEVEVSLTNADVDVKVPAVDVKQGKIKGDLSVGSNELKETHVSVKKSKIKKTSPDMSIPQVKGTLNGESSMSKLSADVPTTGLSVDIEAATTNIHIPAEDVDVPAADLKVKGDGGRFKVPSMKMPSFGVSHPKFKGPDVSVQKPDVNFTLGKPEVDIEGLKIDVRDPECEVDVETPNVDLDGKGNKIKMPKFKGPKFGISAPDTKASKIDVNLPKVDISQPKSDAHVKVLGVDVKSGKMEGDISIGDLELKGPDVSLKMREVKKPSIDIDIPKMKGKFDVDPSITKPELDISTPELSVDIKAPATDIQVPTVDVDVASAGLKVKGDGGGFKMPSMKMPLFGVSLPKFQSPDVAVSVKKPDVDLSLEKPDVDIQGPKIEVRAPEYEVDVDAADVDLTGKGGKIKMPTFKGPKFGFSAPDINAPNIDIKLPKVDISLPKSDVDVKVPGVHVKPGKVEGDISVGDIELKGPDVSAKMPEVEKLSIDVGMPKVKGKFDVDTSIMKPEVDISTPGLSVDIKDSTIDIDVPTVDVDVPAAGLKVKGDGGRFKMPSMKMPSFGVSLPKFQGPDVDLSVKKPDVDLSLGKPEVDIKGPKIDVRAPEYEVDVDAPDVDLTGKGGKIKMPKFKGAKFGISAPDIKVPKIDVNLPKVDITLPKSEVGIKVPRVDVKPGKMEGDIRVGDLDLKGPDVSLKMPEVGKTSTDIGIPRTKVKFDVDTSITKPELDISTPGLSVEIKAPATDIHVPTVDVPAEDLKVKVDGGRFKMPSMKMPAFGVSLPKFQGPDVSVSVKKPDVDLSLGKPEVDIQGPKIVGRVPECKVDVDAPDVDLEGIGGKLKLPKFKAPKFGISTSDIKVPKIDVNRPQIDITLPNSDVGVNVPGVHVTPGKIEGDISVGDIVLKGPDVSLKMPEVGKTSIDIGIPRMKGKFDVDTSITKPELDISTPGLSVDIKAPATDIHVPTVDVDVPSAELKVKGDGGSFKMPSMKMPAFGVSLPKFQGPDVDVSVKKPAVDLSLGKPEVDIQGPKIDVRAPEYEVDVDAPDVDLEGKGGKIKMPKFKGPKFGFSAPDVKGPNIDIKLPKGDISLPKSGVDVNVPRVHVKPGKMEGDISVGDIELKGPGVSVKMPEVEELSIDVGMPKVKGKF